MKSFKSFSQPLSEGTISGAAWLKKVGSENRIEILDRLIKTKTKVEVGDAGEENVVITIDNSTLWKQFVDAAIKYKNDEIKDKNEVLNILKKSGSFEKIFNKGKYSISHITKAKVFGGKSGGGGDTGADAVAKPEDYEQSICVEYNKLKGNDQESAIKAAGLNVADYSRMIGRSPQLTEVGQKVAKQLSAGSKLIHSGSAKGAANYYKRGSDTTPKSDLYGDTSHRFSLKKHGDGVGAQLISAKSGEAAGVFEGASAHFSAVNPDETLKGLNSAMKILNVEMEKTVMSGVEGSVGDARSEFERWYVENSKRTKEVTALINKRGVKTITVGAGTRNEKTYDAKDKSLQRKLAGIIAAHIGAEAKVSGASAARGNPETYLITVDGKSIVVQDIATYLTAFEKGAEFSRESMKKEAAEMVAHSLKTGPWEDEIRKFLDTNTKFQKWLVYEAASGQYKFTGESATKNSAYSGGENAVANKMLVFGDDGFHGEDDIFKWASANTNLVNNLDISFKGSGESRYIKFGIGASYNPSLAGATRQVLAEQYRPRDFVDEAYDIFEQEINNILLTEGLFSKIKGSISSKIASLRQLGGVAVEAIKKAIKYFWENVIKKFMAKLQEWASKGLNFLMETLGIEVIGNVTMGAASF
jgi:hypothetical protein